MARTSDRECTMEAIRMACKKGSKKGSTAVEVERRLGISFGIIVRWQKRLRKQGVEAFPGTVIRELCDGNGVDDYRGQHRSGSQLSGVRGEFNG